MPRKAIRKNHEAIQKRMLAAAARIFEKKGIERLSIRGLAGSLGCSIGTIYNYVEDVDELILRVNGQTIAWLEQALLDGAKSGGGNVPHNVVEAYFDFVEAHPRRWRALFLHYPPRTKTLPAWYLKIVNDIVSNVSAILVPHLDGRSKEECRDITVSLWAMLHGLSLLDQQGKLGNVSDHKPLREVAHAGVRNAFGPRADAAFCPLEDRI